MLHFLTQPFINDFETMFELDTLSSFAEKVYKLELLMQDEYAACRKNFGLASSYVHTYIRLLILLTFTRS